MITDQQARAIAFLAAAARPQHAKRWDENGIYVFVMKVRHMGLADVTAAAMRAAADRTLQTPAAISDTKSSAWRERITQHTTPNNKFEECRNHVGEIASNCRCCAADKLAPNNTTVPLARPNRIPSDDLHAVIEEVKDKARKAANKRTTP